MKRITLAAALLMAGALFIGCDDSPEPITTPPPAVPATQPAPTATGMMDTMKNTAADAQTKAAAATDAAALKATEAKNTAVTTAQKYYDQAKEMIAKRDFSAAQDAVNKLENLKAQLPAEWQAKLDELKTSLTKAKASAPTTMPK